MEKNQLHVVDDQRESPIFTQEVAKQIEQLIPTDIYRTYNCTSREICTWYELAREIFKLAVLKVRVERINSQKLSLPAKRPRNFVLKNYMLKLQGLGIMPPWVQSLAKFIKTLSEKVTPS